MNLSKPIRRRDPQYLAWLHRMPSVVTERNCGTTLQGDSVRIEANHIREYGHGGLGTKPDDSRALPFEDWLHRVYHDIGRAAFEEQYNIDLEAEIKRYNALYLREHPLPKRDRKKTMKAKLSIVNCEACHREHEIPIDKTQMYGKGITQQIRFQCVNKNEWVSVQ